MHLKVCLIVRRNLNRIALAALFYAAFSTAMAQPFKCNPVAKIPHSEVTLIGEIHGTNEIPALAVEQACMLAQGGRHVIFVLELPRDEQSAIDAFLASEGKQVDRKRLISSLFWQSEKNDGRSSIAMLDLLARVRTLRINGAKIAVLAEDGFASEDPDLAMAEAILSARQSFPHAAIIGLFGSFHSSRSPGRERYPHQAIGYRLRTLRPLTIYVNFTGWAWGCNSESCGVMRVGVVRPDSIFFTFIPGDDIDHAHDGVLNLPKVTASPPARYLLSTY